MRWLALDSRFWYQREAEKIRIFHFRVSFPFHSPVSPPPQIILGQMSSGSSGLADRCVWQGLYPCSHTSPLCAYPAAWYAASLPSLRWLLRNPQSAAKQAQLPTALSGGDALGVNTVTELGREFFWRAWEAHRNRSSFLVACFHEKCKIVVFSRALPFIWFDGNTFLFSSMDTVTRWPYTCIGNQAEKVIKNLHWQAKICYRKGIYGRGGSEKTYIQNFLTKCEGLNFFWPLVLYVSTLVI